MKLTHDLHRVQTLQRAGRATQDMLTASESHNHSKLVMDCRASLFAGIQAHISKLNCAIFHDLARLLVRVNADHIEGTSNLGGELCLGQAMHVYD